MILLGPRALARRALCVLLCVLCPLGWHVATAMPLPAKRKVKRPVIKRLYRHNQPRRDPSAVSLLVYHNVKALGMEILERFPPNEYYYVGMGHSPGHIVAFLQALSRDLAQTLPASELSTTTYAELERYYPGYREHFEALLPDAVIEGGRKILLIDYSAGSSPTTLQKMMRRYLRDLGSKVEVKTASFYSRDTKTGTDFQLTAGDASMAKDTKDVSEFKYVKYRIGRDSLADLKRDRRWAPRVKAYREWMSQDPEVDGFIRRQLADFMEGEKDQSAAVKRRSSARKKGPQRP